MVKTLKIINYLLNNPHNFFDRKAKHCLKMCTAATDAVTEKIFQNAAILVISLQILKANNSQNQLEKTNVMHHILSNNN